MVPRGRFALLLLAIVSLLGETLVLGEGSHEGQPAIKMVLNMLGNLVSMIEKEAASDEEEHETYTSWSAGETQSTTQQVKLLKSEIETTSASLADLGSQKVDLDKTLDKIKIDLGEETSQLNAATERRQEENADFVTEQQNFENAITACGQAVEILGGVTSEKKELKKPKFMGLIGKAMALVKNQTVNIAQGKLSAKTAILIQQFARGPSFDTYKGSKEEAGGIVDQVKALMSTFQEDKKTAIETERGLEEAYVTLSGQKNELIGTLTTERDTQQSQLDTVEQGIAENQGALQMATDTLGDKQGYLQDLSSQLYTAETTYRERKMGRNAETTAVKQAMGVLGRLSLIQTTNVKKQNSVAERTLEISIHELNDFSESSAVRHIADRAQTLQHNSELLAAAIFADLRHGANTTTPKIAPTQLRQVGSGCIRCPKAVALLRSKASVMHSTLLSTAASAAMAVGNDQLEDVIKRLQGLLTNLDQEQKSETEHKDWCDSEIQHTTEKRDGHQTKIEQLQAALNSLTELISMKKSALEENSDDLRAENAAWAGVDNMRSADKARYDEDLDDTVDARDAMNEAIGILQKFYASRKKKAMLQQEDTAEDPDTRILLEAIDGNAGSHPEAPSIDSPQLVQLSAGALRSRADVTEMTNPNSGSQVVSMMVNVRKKFDASAKQLRAAEASAVAAHESTSAAHQKALEDLAHNKDVLTVEKQTAEQAWSSNTVDMTSTNTEMAASISYLIRVSESCKPLIDNYAQRKRLRAEERKAIDDAIKTLREV